MLESFKRLSWQCLAVMLVNLLNVLVEAALPYPCNVRFQPGYCTKPHKIVWYYSLEASRCTWAWTKGCEFNENENEFNENKFTSYIQCIRTCLDTSPLYRHDVDTMYVDPMKYSVAPKLTEEAIEQATENQGQDADANAGTDASNKTVIDY